MSPAMSLPAIREDQGETEIVARKPDGTFAKGQSGNPMGRPKVAGEFVELLREHTHTALEALVEIIESGSPDAARVAAAVALLDRAYGKPRQAIEHSGVDGLPVGFRVMLIPPGDDDSD
jgi:hypothetical protein